MQPVPTPLCPECTDDRHAVCTGVAAEPAEDNPNQLQAVICGCGCEGGLEAWGR